MVEIKTNFRRQPLHTSWNDDEHPDLPTAPRTRHLEKSGNLRSRSIFTGKRQRSTGVLVHPFQLWAEELYRARFCTFGDENCFDSNIEKVANQERIGTEQNRYDC